MPRIKPDGPNSLASASKEGGLIDDDSSPNATPVLAAAVVVVELPGPCIRLRSESKASPGWLTRDDTCANNVQGKAEY